MEQKAYDYIEHGETSWWYQGRADFACQYLTNGLRPAEARTILDFGAGFGALYPVLTPYGAVDAFEIEPAAIERCRTRGYEKVLSSRSELSTGTRKYDLICAFDVLEHMESELETLALLRSLLAPGGQLLLTVPAYQFLWSEHDVLHKHFRRYTRRRLTDTLRAAGFTVTHASYWNMLLFPVAYLMRLLGRGGGDALTPATPVNAALRAVVYLESRLVPALSLPFGTGVIALANAK